MSDGTVGFIVLLLFMAVVGISAMYFISKQPTDGITAMSNEQKCTASLQADIAQQYRNMNSKPGLEIGLRPELGTFELCDKHYDASRTESEEHCAVCKLEQARRVMSASTAEVVRTRERLLEFVKMIYDAQEEWAAEAHDVLCVVCNSVQKPPSETGKPSK